ncbi:hypothetical protein BZG36_05746, partial [Bifiguratus adelaidae]
EFVEEYSLCQVQLSIKTTPNTDFFYWRKTNDVPNRNDVYRRRRAGATPLQSEVWSKLSKFTNDSQRQTSSNPVSGDNKRN